MLYLLLAGGAVVAFTISAMAGGGAGLILLPLIGLILPAAHVPAALSIGTATSSLARLRVFRAAIRWDIVRWFLPAALPLTVVGAWLLTKIEPTLIVFGLGLFLCGNLVTLFRADRERLDEAMPGRVRTLIVGAAAGFLSGFTGAVGLVFNGFYLRSGLRKEEIVATRAANEVLLHLVKLGLYTWFGLMQRDTLLVGAIVAAAGIVATFGARYLLTFVREAHFRSVGRVAMALAGIGMLGQAGTALAARHGIDVKSRIDWKGVEARVAWGDQTILVEWRRGEHLEIERTVALASLPASIRMIAERESVGATRILCEEVRGFGTTFYEISIDWPGRSVELQI